jgi:hypothetical protein
LELRLLLHSSDGALRVDELTVQDMFLNHNTIAGHWVFEGEEAEAATPSHRVVLITAAGLQGEQPGSTIAYRLTVDAFAELRDAVLEGLIFGLPVQPADEQFGIGFRADWLILVTPSL